MNFVDIIYSWNNQTLLDFLNKGNIPRKWSNFFKENEKLIIEISDKLENLIKKSEKPYIIYPPINMTFRAFIPVEKMKLVILGQDPYHNKGSAVGYCFSVCPGNSINPSLRNIYTELKNEKYNINEDGTLYHWVKQGCFLLNTSLTVKENTPESHVKIWLRFIEKVIEYVVKEGDNILWLLMGAKAYKFQDFIPKKLTFSTSHPSPLSAYKNTAKLPSFFGSNVFRNINEALKKQNKKEIKW